MTGYCPGCGRTDMAGITHICPPVETRNWSNQRIDATTGAGGVCSKHGLYSGLVCPTCRASVADQLPISSKAEDSHPGSDDT